MTEIVAVDIGGTHARFGLAEVAEGRVRALHAAKTLKTVEYASFQTAWEAFGAQLGRAMPSDVAIAFAGPVDGDVLQLTNSHWAIRPTLIKERLHVERYTLVNDFAAVAHAVAQAPAEAFIDLCGPAVPLPDAGIVSIVGPGTGLGVAQLIVFSGSDYQVNATEGGHVDYAPLDSFEDGLLAMLRTRMRRVSTERIAAAPGICAIYEALAALENRTVDSRDAKAVWTAALDGSDSLAVAAFDRYCMTLGSIAGDIALAQGATMQGRSAVVIAGGHGARIAAHLPQSGFAQRFAAKGRFEAMMNAVPVKLITMEQPGLFGAAAAFAMEHMREHSA